MLRNIIYIPQWIAEATQRQGENLSVVLDLNKLKEFVSVEDLAGLAALNNTIGDLLGMDITLSIGSGLTKYWQAKGCEQTSFYIANTIYPNITPKSAKNVLDRLMIAEQEVDFSDSFDTIDLGYESSAVLLKYGFFTSTNIQDMQFKLIESILQILYVYHPHHTIGNSPIGELYLKLLSQRQ